MHRMEVDERGSKLLEVPAWLKKEISQEALYDYATVANTYLTPSLHELNLHTLDYTIKIYDMDRNLVPWYKRSIGKTSNLKPRLLDATKRVQSRLPFRSYRKENGLLYKPLDTTKDEFRLLSLEPNADPDSTITCRLFTASLTDEPSYTALSYVWGDPTITKPIFVNDIEVQVTVNLEVALRHIREAHEEIVIWVDALCINQSDVHERNKQVTRMKELYSKTQLVYAWLGDDTNGTVEAVFQHMSKVSSYFGGQIEELEDFFGEFRHYIESDLGQKAQKTIIESYRTGILSVSEAFYEDLSAFTDQPYWQRIWIQQELLLAPKVLLLCGRFSSPLRDFLVWRMSLEYVDIEQTIISSFDANIPTTSDTLNIPTIVNAIWWVPDKLASVLATFGRCEATLPHDYIYGALGSGEFRRYYSVPLYFPWYKAEITFTSNPEILRTYGWIIDTVKTVTLFDNSEENFAANSRIAWNFLQNNVATKNPAGIPFLQAICRNIFHYRRQCDFLDPTLLYQIRSFFHWVFKMGAEDDHLQYDSSVMSNSRFDNFLKQHGLENLFESFETLPHEIVQSLLFAKYTGAIEHLIEPYRGAKDHTSFSSMTAQQRMAPFWGCDTLPAEFLADVEWRVEFESNNAISMEKELQKVSYQTLIVTQQGYTGLATRDASIGDSICLVRGCPHPTLIRSFGQSYEVVGQSFIVGLMENELFKDGTLTEKNGQMLDFV
ncbi:heterokaryon incompatibility protein [Pyrenophora teres f. teres]|uniref:Heterokaryon incompatibility protein n=1 Tax=Pyrenophora teres f. teres TaxID=97479 RepID=A0A6S6W2M6_9PLEO|nr:heterokaryon incompatibility protein [Pyrenophora teres f. teres]